MNCRMILSLAGALLAAALFLCGAVNAEGLRASGPYVHENLAIYFIHGDNKRGEPPLTLQEAMKAETVLVHETGDVNELAIENLGDRDVFVQSGDIVKGGKQDRVLTSSMVVAPRSGRAPVASLSVEEGRWAARGSEADARFSNSESMVPSKYAKLAMKADIPVQVAGIARIDGAPRSSRQHEMWRSVVGIQESLARSLGRSVTETVSRISLQLSLENVALKERQGQYVKGLEQLPQDETIVGYAFAVNGRLSSADVYVSQALFANLWPKLLRASATEAIAESGRLGDGVPASKTVEAFLAGPEAGPAKAGQLTADVRLETRETNQVIYSETQRTGGGWVHRNYLAK